MNRKLTFGEPFIETRILEDEKHYHTSGRCIVVNLGREAVTLEESFALQPLETVIASDGTVLDVPGKALLIANSGLLDLNDLKTLDVMRGVWKSNFELTHSDKQRGVPYYKSPRIDLNDVHMNFCLVSEPDYPSGIHRTHSGNINELHVQIAGDGAVELMRSDSHDSCYASFPMTAGDVHCPIWNELGAYPWHRYRSISRCVFLAVEIDR